MKATGITRRIDDLGRIVIPKEIRKNLRLKNGENLEIFIDEKDNILLRKSSSMDRLREFAFDIVRAINNVTKNEVFITDTSVFIAATSKKYLETEISSEIGEMMDNRQIISEGENICLIENEIEKSNFIFCPIIAAGDVVGSIIVILNQKVENMDVFLKIISLFLANHIEEWEKKCYNRTKAMKERKIGNFFREFMVGENKQGNYWKWLWSCLTDI